jgi:hypothetical protein
MSTPYQLATMIEMVAPRLHPALVCRDNVDSILAIARVLPSWQCAGFECRLGDPAPRADFGVHLRRTHGIPIDGELLGEGGPLDSDPGEAWQRLRRFAHAWSGRQSIILQAVPAVSLEFDVHNPRAARVAAPSIFFSIRFGSGRPGRSNAGAVNACRAVVQAVLEALGVDAADAGHKLEDCFRVLLPRVSFLQFGVWLARSVNTFRICAPGLRLHDIHAVVHALRWSGPSDAYESQWRGLLQFGDTGALHLDVGSEVSPQLGVEVNFGEASASLNPHDPEDTRFFDYLVANDLCLPEKRDAVLSWVGGFRLGHRGSGADTAPLFLRTISHVKLVFQPDQAPQAKAYLAVGRIDRQTKH